ncbi:MAG: hypothetical protein DYG86_04780 [Chloroflexi bacterium CFX2]|nr:hypothetical protein [Chloroflexi bacterium CFX2]
MPESTTMNKITIDFVQKPQFYLAQDGVPAAGDCGGITYASGLIRSSWIDKHFVEFLGAFE